ncbi:MAG: OprO/OprP family phosphate-selective porin [Acidobacteriia bacterium]|nr:OprO/OprP family phosphate-selective porin [Terriglobia bacterium]
MKQVALFLCLTGFVAALADGQDRDKRIADLERQLTEAKGSVAALQKTIDSLATEVQALRQPGSKAAPATAAATPVAKETSGGTDGAEEFAARIIGPDNGSDERDSMLGAKPEIFIQTRYSVAPIDGSGTAFQPNMRLSRIETRWAGKINERIGAGIEIQFQESVEGSPEKLVNDAFLEYYLNDHTTIRAGQFIKPFGFDIQQSSWLRESPERPIFSGYFFPGERDRGIMLSGDLGFLPAPGFKDLQYFVGAFNGNRFFNDSNRQVNYMGRIRKSFNKKLAVGASVQLGKQLLPPGVSGNDNERLFGFDFQVTAGRFGLRGEALTGNMPSTPASIEPEFFQAFRPGAHNSAGELLTSYRLAGAQTVYARYNQFNGDPVTGLNIRAFNFGYFLPVGERSRLSFDYQFKNHASFEDDAVNGRFQITWGILVK